MTPAASFLSFLFRVSAEFNQPSLFLPVFPPLFLLYLSILLPQHKEAEPEKPQETNLAEQSEQAAEVKDTEAAAPPNSEVSEVEIPSVGRILVRSDADGYDEEVQRRVQGSCVLFFKRCVS